MSKNVSKHASWTIGGAAAALLATLGAPPAGAQSGTQAGMARRDTSIERHVLILTGRMDSIAMLSSRIMREEYGSAAWLEASEQLDSLLLHSVPRIGVRGMIPRQTLTLRAAQSARGWLGFNTQGPMATIVDSSGVQRVRFFAYQPIISVDLGSPADRAGIAPGDVLVAYNGVDLINHEFNLSDLLVPKKHVGVSVRRNGDVKDYTLTVAPAPDEISRRRKELEGPIRIALGRGMIIAEGEADPAMAGTVRARGGSRGERFGGMGSMEGFNNKLMAAPKLFFMSQNGLFGASLSTVNEELSQRLKLKRGVLVNEAPEDSPAWRAGLRTGDVIVAADGQAVVSFGQLREAVIRASDQSVELRVVRDQKERRVHIDWP